MERRGTFKDKTFLMIQVIQVIYSYRIFNSKGSSQKG